MNLKPIGYLLVSTVALVAVTPLHAAELTSFGGNYQASLASDHLASEVALGDLDGDDDLDAWVVNTDSQSEIWINDGPGAFTLSNQIAGHPAIGVALGDLDGDGDLDAFLAGTGANRIWLNLGNGLFADSGQRLGTALSHAVALGDVDGDQDLDAWVGNAGPGNLWLNDGNGVFTDSGQVLGSENRWAWDVAFGDLDGDLDLDVVVAIGNAGSATAENGSEIWLNDGSGVFTQTGQTIGDSHAQHIALGNLDDDTAPDVFAVNSDLFGSVANRIWINDGSAGFTVSELVLDGPESTSSNENSLWGWGAALGDFNGDQKTDIFVANGGVYADLGNRVYFNDGGGVFVDGGQVLGNQISQSVAVGNLNGDEYPDAWVANQGGAHEIWLGQSDGNFVKGTSPVHSHLGYSHTLNTGIVAGDLNKNGFADAILTSVTDGAVVLLNNGQGGLFTTTGKLGAASNYGAAIGDLDGDTDLDVWLTTDGADRVWLNDNANLSFTDSGQAIGNDPGNRVALGDLDGDLDLDAWVANDGPDRIWLNEGNGVFTDSGQLISSINSSWVALGDLDGDLDLDAWIANRTDGSDPLKTVEAFDEIWLNDGDGNFSLSGQVLSNSVNMSVALGDLDGDLDLDAWVASGGFEKRSDQIWFNDGDGNFTLGEQVIEPAATFQTKLADIDGDGDLDAVCANTLNRGEGANTIWLNDGSGNFTKFEQTLGSGNTRSVAVLDANGDGDLDIAFAYENAPVQLWINGGTNGSRFVRGESGELKIEFAGSLKSTDSLDEAFVPVVNVASPLTIPVGQNDSMRFYLAR